MPLGTIRTRWKEVVLWGLCFTALFALGWWRGTNPDFTWRGLLFTPDEVIILTSDRSWLPDAFIDELSKAADAKIRIEEVQDFADFEARLVTADAPPLIWIPLSWAKGLASQDLLFPAGVRRALRNSVHKDFRSIAPDLTFLPVLWSFDTSVLRIEGLAVPMNSPHRRTGMMLATIWTRTELAHRQLDLVPVASALTFSSASDLPFERRADALRNHPLSALKTWK